MSELDLVTRPADSGDLGFIYHSWMNSLWRLAPWSELNKNWFFAAQHALVSQLLKRAGCIALVACSPRNADLIYGFIVAEPEEQVLHWLYTKAAKTRSKGLGYRRAGVATSLMEEVFPALGEDPIVCSIRTPVCADLPQAWRLTYNTARLCRKVEDPL